jgi:hypothetical protein
VGTELIGFGAVTAAGMAVGVVADAGSQVARVCVAGTELPGPCPGKEGAGAAGQRTWLAVGGEVGEPATASLLEQLRAMGVRGGGVGVEYTRSSWTDR